MKLIKISQAQIGDSAVNAVNARDLHKVLEVKTAFSHWIKRRLEETMAEEGVDFIVAKNGIVENTLFQAVEYIISLDTAKEIAMLERSEIGKKVRKHFIECEKELQNQNKLTLPKTYKEALLELVRAEEEKERLLIQAKENEPKVQCFNELMDSKNAISFANFSKIIGIGEIKLFAMCREAGILMSNNKPYQKHIDAEHFRVVEKTFNKGNYKTSYSQTLITPKGQAYLTKKFKGDSEQQIDYML